MEKLLKSEQLTDEELDKVSAGGYYYPVDSSKCPYGHSKYVFYVSSDGGGCPNAIGCEHYKARTIMGFVQQMCCDIAGTEWIWEPEHK